MQVRNLRKLIELGQQEIKVEPLNKSTTFTRLCLQMKVSIWRKAFRDKRRVVLIVNKKLVLHKKVFRANNANT